jgi:hypothetical protein
MISKKGARVAIPDFHPIFAVLFFGFSNLL